MESNYFFQINLELSKSEDKIRKGKKIISIYHDALLMKSNINLGYKSKFNQMSCLDQDLIEFYKTWSKFPRLGIPEDRYMNIIEKILEYTQMIIDHKGVDYQTLPGMKEFVELVDQQFEEIVSKDPKLDALRKDPYGL